MGMLLQLHGCVGVAACADKVNALHNKTMHNIALSIRRTVMAITPLL
jgi:hypothetical protein